MGSTVSRVQSVDLLRGAVMVLMAVDHVRVYAGVPAGGSTPALFFTRWITHFCAPSFVFWAGASAFLYAQKNQDKGKVAAFLLTRGLLLVLMELTIIRLSWTFNLNLNEFMLAGVIWMLGWCMVLLAGLVWLRPVTVGVTGLLIIAGQQLFSLVTPGPVWAFFYPSGEEGFPGIAILYVLIPWIGVMAAGYAFGAILLKPPPIRNRICYGIGGLATVTFVIAGIITAEPLTLFGLLNQNKYPPSILYLLMTLGPVILLVPFAENARGWLANALKIVGRVPLFYYLVHIWIIHVSALPVQWLRTGAVHHEWYATAPFASVPPEQQWSLPLLYLVFAIDVFLLYLLCRWYERYKFSHPQNKILRYL